MVVLFSLSLLFFWKPYSQPSCAPLEVMWRLFLQALDWNLFPETPISWLKLYAQVEAQKDENFLEPQFSQDKYIQITQVSFMRRKASWPWTNMELIFWPVCCSCWTCVWWTSTRWTTATAFSLLPLSATSHLLMLFIESQVGLLICSVCSHSGEH